MIAAQIESEAREQDIAIRVARLGRELETAVPPTINRLTFNFLTDANSISLSTFPGHFGAINPPAGRLLDGTHKNP